MAAGLRALGVGEGDRVCAYMPNIPETIACLLACASIGAIWSSAAPEFGARSVIDRFVQIEPKVLLTIDGYRYGGKDFDRSEIVERVTAEMRGLSKVVRLGYLDGSGWEDGFLGPADAELSFAQVPFDHPLWVLYSSGTTGLPKAIVQSQGGMLLEQLKHHKLHVDARAGDRVFWFSTTGWMMWNFLVGVLLTDAAVVLFDGNPGYPSLDRLWELSAEAQITTFGTSAAFIASCMKAEVSVTGGGERDLSALRAVGSTGSPLSPEGFQWIYDQVGSDTWLFSTSGGTDVCTAFVGGVPTLPVYLGELQGRALGCDVQAWDPDGNPAARRGRRARHLPADAVDADLPVGRRGRVAATRVLLRDVPRDLAPRRLDRDHLARDRDHLRPLGFDDQPRRRADGDGRDLSRGVIGAGGLDALVSTFRGGTDGWMPLFVVLAEGQQLTDELVATIRRRVREDCSPRHVPTRSARSTRSRGRYRARCSKCRSSGS